jgi:glycogen phosphorylase
MSNPIFTNRPAETQREDALAEMALDLHWTWNHSTDKIWERLDPELWELTHNPWFVLQAVSREKLESIRAEPEFDKLLNDVLEEERARVQSPGWFQKTYPDTCLKCVAYFSMEFMLSEALPIYSGGLGNVAGDQLKTASNLDVPVVGIGLLYQQGYFRQEIDAQGRQQALYPFNDPGQLPIRPVRQANGEWMRFPLAFPGFRLWVRAWEVRLGRTKLLLLDTNDPANIPPHRGITSELYGGGPELRLKQELVLGIGGWRLLRALGFEPQVCHLNEGHAAFAVLERASSYMADHKQPFEVAWTITRAGNLFTTHTPVEAGFDRFQPELIQTYLKKYAEEHLSISFEDLLALGRRNRNDPSEPFNMAYLAMRGSNRVNGVSRLHGAVSRRIFRDLYPRWPEAEVPVTHVTNGVHVPTWDSAEADRIWEAACGKERWHWTMAEMEQDFRAVMSNSELWQLRAQARKSLIEYVRQRLRRQLEGHGASAEAIAEAGRVLNPDALTLGFARRFATYKRPNLLLHDPERLVRILTSQERPVQLILAGKAHPQDLAGQAMVQQWVNFARRPDVRPHAVFLADYDMLMAERLVGGIDVWINTPRRPWEASGTSGMKVLVNGGLNLSELDGWWAEAYSPEVGWALGDGKERGDDPAWDAAEAEALYNLLENKVVPEFYTRERSGVSPDWVSRMRESMARLTPAFSSNRVVREYTEKHYLPAAAEYCRRSADGGEAGQEIVNWQRELVSYWPKLRFGSLRVEHKEGEHVFKVELYLDDLNPEAVQVELYAEPQDALQPVRQIMNRGEKLAGGTVGFVYTAAVSAGRPATDFTPRVVPCHAGASVPLEAPFVLWRDTPG